MSLVTTDQLWTTSFVTESCEIRWQGNGHLILRLFFDLMAISVTAQVISHSRWDGVSDKKGSLKYPALSSWHPVVLCTRLELLLVQITVVWSQKCQKIKWSHKAVSMPTISQHTLLSQLTLPVEEHDLTGYVFHSIDGNDSIIGLCWEWFIIIQDWNSCHERLLKASEMMVLFPVLQCQGTPSTLWTLKRWRTLTD